MKYQLTRSHSQRGGETTRSKAIFAYQQHPKICPNCNSCLLYKYRKNQFCGSSCAAAFNNTFRVVKESTKSLLRLKALAREAVSPRMPRKIKEPLGPYTKLIRTSCSVCNATILGITRARKCKAHQHLYSAKGRAKFQFTFHYGRFPDIFDVPAVSQLIQTHGWRKTKGEGVNINGVTRDHKVSVRDAILHNYSPYYIKHPLNCEFMVQSDNIKKGTTSSITYPALVKLVDDYEATKLVIGSGLEPASHAYEAYASTLNASRRNGP